MRFRIIPVVLFALAFSSPAWAQTKPADLGPAMELLESGKNQEAAKELEAILAQYPKTGAPKDETLTNALHGAAVAYARMNQIPKARTAIDRAASGPYTNRSLQLNRAKLDSTNRSTYVRAAKALIEAQQSDGVDENLLNLTGFCLADALDGSAGRAAAKTLTDEYASLNLQLEATKPGQRRFGSRWLPADQYEATVNPPALVGAIANAEKIIAGLKPRFDDHVAKAKDAQRRAQQGATPSERDAAQREYERERSDAAAVKAQIESQQDTIKKARAQFPKPEWVKDATLGLPDFALTPK